MAGPIEPQHEVGEDETVHKSEVELKVLGADTIIDPHAVVVHHMHTAATLTAVMHVLSLYQVAFRA